MNTTVSATIEANRKILSTIGQSLGTGIFQVEPRSCDPDFEKNKLLVQQNDDLTLMVNREIKRYHIFSHNIRTVAVGLDAQNASKVDLITDSDKKISLPITTDLTQAGKVTDDALRAAIKGDKNIIFANARKLCDEVNAINRNEIGRVEKLIETLQAIKSGLNNAIIANEKKANDYEKQLLDSTPKNFPTTGKAEIHIEATVENA